METVAYKDMNRAVTFILTMLLTVNITIVSADGSRLSPDFEVPIGTTSVCTSEQILGFRKGDKNWRKTTFSDRKYTIKKVQPPLDDVNELPFDNCNASLTKRSDNIKGNKTTLHRCYMFNDGLSIDYCAEVYDTNILVKVFCPAYFHDEVVFEPNGTYVSRSDLNLSPHAFSIANETISTPAEISVEHGECTTN